ncbi:hypothetical protein PBI_MELONS_66 [Arthrobacter phage Melons]|uniref:Uncharacterized protein n=1 Tax=Arthrobacter phage Melons TaxID=2419962 RepID=A0A3G2KHY5_9CAUD|nr:hypothetical protein PBI_MELONS_66 [Arthrobacter phage Melons]
MMGKRERKKAAMGAAVCRFMDKRFGVEVVVVDSVDDPRGIVVLRTDGALLTAEQARALELYLRGYRVFGGPS